MGNSAKKKEAARLHNERMKKRKLAQESERLDRIENPEKYAPSKEALKHARTWLAIAGGMGFIK